MFFDGNRKVMKTDNKTNSLRKRNKTSQTRPEPVPKMSDSVDTSELPIQESDYLEIDCEFVSR